MIPSFRSLFSLSLISFVVSPGISPAVDPVLEGPCRWLTFFTLGGLPVVLYVRSRFLSFRKKFPKTFSEHNAMVMIGSGLLFILWGLTAGLLVLIALFIGIAWTGALIRILMIAGGFFLISGILLSIIGAIRLRKIRRSRRGD